MSLKAQITAYGDSFDFFVFREKTPGNFIRYTFANRYNNNTVYDHLLSQVYYLNTCVSTGLLFEAGVQYEVFALHSVTL